MNIILRIISSIFMLIAEIISFLFGNIFKGLGKLIEQLTIKAGMILFGFAFISYIANHI